MGVPSVSSISPSAGPTSGRNIVRIVGANFQLSPPPGPMVAGQLAQAANPTVEVLFGNRKARDVRVLSSTRLHVLAPISDPGAVSITVRNLNQDGTGVAGETVTIANGYTFERPDVARKPSNEVTLQRVVRALVVEMRRQLLQNTVLTTNTDYADSPSGANVAALADVPGIVLSGPRLIENREYSLNSARKKQGFDGEARLYPPRTVDLEFTLIGVDNLENTIIALMHECVVFFQKNIVLSVPADASVPDGTQIEYDMDLNRDGQLAMIAVSGNSNVRAFSGTFRVRGIDIDPDDAAFVETFIVVDPTTGISFQQLPPSEEE